MKMSHCSGVDDGLFRDLYKFDSIDEYIEFMLRVIRTGSFNEVAFPIVDLNVHRNGDTYPIIEDTIPAADVEESLRKIKEIPESIKKLSSNQLMIDINAFYGGVDFYC